MTLDLSPGKKLGLSFLIMGAMVSSIYMYWTHHQNDFALSTYKKVADSSNAEVYQYKSGDSLLQNSSTNLTTDSYSLSGHLLTIAYPIDFNKKVRNANKPVLTLTDKQTYDTCSKEIIGNVAITESNRDSVVCLTRSRAVSTSTNSNESESQQVKYVYVMSKTVPVADSKIKAPISKIYPQITFTFDQECQKSYTSCDVGYEEELVQKIEPIFAEIVSTVSVSK